MPAGTASSSSSESAWSISSRHSECRHRAASAGCSHWGRRPWFWSACETAGALPQWHWWCRSPGGYPPVFEVDRQVLPLTAPGLDDYRVLSAPAALQFVQGGFSSLFAYGLVDRLQIGHEGLLVLRGHVLHRVADLVNDAQLHLGLRKDGVDGLWETLEAIDGGNENVFDTAIAQVSYY